MALELVDFAAQRPGAAALVAAGKSGVLRYLPYGGLAKGLTAAEVADYHGHGLDIGLIWESTTIRAASGSTGGVADGHAAADAIRSLGAPADVPVYFAVDWDAQSSQQAEIDAYLRGAATVLGPTRIGVYAGVAVVRRCQASRSAAWYWQTYAWSYGQIASGIHLYQYRNNTRLAGVEVDLDRAQLAEWGAWRSEAPMLTAQPADPPRFRLTLRPSSAIRLIRRRDGGFVPPAPGSLNAYDHLRADASFGGADVTNHQDVYLVWQGGDECFVLADNVASVERLDVPAVRPLVVSVAGQVVATGQV